MKILQTSPASRWILWHSSASEVVAVEETIHPTSTCCKLLISAVSHGDVHLFLHHPDHFAGHSLAASPFVDNSSLHVYLRLLSILLPASSRQPGPVAVLLGQILKLRFIFSPLSQQKVWISSCPFYFFAAPEPWRSSVWYWLKESSTICEKGKEEKCAVSVDMSSSLI